jgi:oxygen-independent coproporphyrinogen-3 oxidase
MAGLYVHIPFCARACTYCDFHFTTRLRDREDMVQALIAELRSALPAWSGQTFTTLYFGGGTPSVLRPAELSAIAAAAMEGADWALEEWTVEANPEDLDRETLDELKAAGVDRLSIGVQSFQPEVLDWMNRLHGAAGAQNAVERAAEAGFEHLSLDLIYGVPVGGEDRWEQDLGLACTLPVNHLSCYILTAEPKTLYGHQLASGTLSPPPDDRVLEEYARLCEVTKSAGFEHYEVSNFARSEGRSRHNSAYWNGTPYLGIGPGAHSFLDGRRWWNARSNARYLQAATTSDFPGQQETETLGAKNRFNEALITGLRRVEGVAPADLIQLTGLDVTAQPALQGLLDRGRCEWVDGRLRIPEAQWPLGDATTLELMV